MAKRKINSNLEDHNGIRLNSHEKVCAERMKTLFKSIDELKKEVKEMRADMNKGKGAVNFLLILGGLAGIILGFLKWNG
tara:strand:- start:115 stop:351 length:237 start_codon:yes stop_codon:yes gene_type:complete